MLDIIPTKKRELATKALDSIKNHIKTTLYEDSHWEFNGEIPENRPHGFVYCITNKKLNKRYIGKRQMVAGTGEETASDRKRKPEWKFYQGSSALLKTDFGLFDANDFHYEIIDFYYTSKGLIWAEHWVQTLLEVSTEYNNHLFYNVHIAAITSEIVEQVTPKTRKFVFDLQKKLN